MTGRNGDEAIGDEPFRIETPRLILRDWQEEDWPPFFLHLNTPAVMQWLGGVMDEAQMAAQRRRIEECRATHGHGFWVVERKADGGHMAGELLGFCGLKRGEAPGSPVEGEFEIGWRLREDAWGHGYAKEAALASLDAAFAHFGAEQVVALTMVENAPSWGLMQRIGMARRADLDHQDMRPHALFRDNIVHAITREQWGPQK